MRQQRSPRLDRSLLIGLIGCCLMMCASGTGEAAPPAPQNLVVEDHPWDGGHALDVSFDLVASGEDDDATRLVRGYLVQRSGEPGGPFRKVAEVEPDRWDVDRGRMTVVVDECVRGEPYWFRVASVAPDGSTSPWAASPADTPATPRRQAFDGSRAWLALFTVIICASVATFIALARRGVKLKIRPIAGLEAVEDAVGRATEMGRSSIFVPGIQDMNDMQTIAGLTILSRVAKQAAEYDCDLETPTARSLVMTAAQETVEAAYLTAGRPDAYNPASVYYVTDEQFAYVSYITGKIVRDKPAACFYMGAFFAESLILAETGNAVGAIQVAGTAQPAQLPFFVAACDYTLIGEEFFAASAYLSHDPDQLGSLKGQDVGKIIVGGLILVGIGLVTAAELSGDSTIAWAAYYLKDVVLHAGS